MSEMLHDRIENQLFLQYPDIPNYIIDNLNHHLRPYQEEAVQRLMYLNEQDESNLYNKLMFNMATGSGKTLVLAASVLYLFKEKGYQNFLFFVNSTAIVNKTYDNLTNKNLNKIEENPTTFLNGTMEIARISDWMYRNKTKVAYQIINQNFNDAYDLLNGMLKSEYINIIGFLRFWYDMNQKDRN